MLWRHLQSIALVNIRLRPTVGFSVNERNDHPNGGKRGTYTEKGVCGAKLSPEPEATEGKRFWA